MIKKGYKFSELTLKIIGCAMTVHSALGNGFQEVIYQRALEIEMKDRNLGFSREYEMTHPKKRGYFYSCNLCSQNQITQKRDDLYGNPAFKVLSDSSNFKY